MQHQNETLARYYSKKKKLKKRKKIAFYAILVVLSVTVVTVLSLTVFFNISKITVKGNAHYSTEQIIKVAGLKKGQNLFRLNKFKIIETLEKKLPYLETVTIKRKLPVGISITVTETEPFMAVDYKNGYLLVDENMKILKSTDVMPGKLAYVSGIKPSVTKSGNVLDDKKGLCDKLKKLAPILKKHLEDGKVSQIIISEVYDIQFIYDERVTVKLGTLENVDEKVRLVAHTLANNSDGERAIIEFSLNNRLHYRSID